MWGVFGWGIVIFVICVFLVIAAARRSPKNVTQAISSSKNISFTINVDKSTALKTIIDFAHVSGYKVDHFDETQYEIVLSDSASATTWGFFYMVKIKDITEGIDISIGIKSKAVQVGAIKTRNLEKFTNGVKAALFVKTQ